MYMYCLNGLCPEEGVCICLIYHAAAPVLFLEKSSFIFLSSNALLLY